MKKQRLTTEALVLRVFDWSESSQTARILTPSLGRLGVLAKGILKPNAYLLGPMDVLQWADVEILFDPRAELHLLVRFHVRSGLLGLRRDLETLATAHLLVEIADQGTRQAIDARRLFVALRGALLLLEREPEDFHHLLVAWFGLLALADHGVLPEFSACVSCQRPAPASGPVRFAPAHGGLLCRSCAVHPTRLINLPSSLRAVLRALIGPRERPSEVLLSVPAEAERTPPPLRRAAMEFVLELLEGLFERELRAKACLESGALDVPRR